MKALVLKEKGVLAIEDLTINRVLQPNEVRVAIKSVGICGSDVHYYTHGEIGPFVVRKPMILGHEAAGVVIETGADVSHLKTGDRVCMEPGIPNPRSRATRIGMYNLDPEVRFWATPPIDGCLVEEVVHSADFTFKIADSLSFAQGAMVEPLAVGMHAATKAVIQPGDLGLVLGAGTIGVVTALAALSGGCSRVVVTDIKQAKLDMLAPIPGIIPINTSERDLHSVINELSPGWGADVVFECSGAPAVIKGVFDELRPGGTVVLVGMPPEPCPLDIVASQAKEANIKTIFRYAHMYPKALALMASGKIDLSPFITHEFKFEQAIEAFEWAATMPDNCVKAVINM